MADSPPPPPPGFTLVDAPPPPPPGFTMQQARTDRRARPYSATDLISSKATMGLSDKVGAAGDAIGGYLGSLIAGKDGGSVSDRYDQAYTREIAARDAYKAEHPGVDWATLPANLLGVGPGAAATGATRAVTALAARKLAIKTGAVAGTVTGTAAGVGNSRGDALQQAGQVALSAGAGALTGGVAARYLPGLIEAGAGAASKVYSKASSYLGSLLNSGEAAVGAGSAASGAPRSIHSSGPGQPSPAATPATAGPAAGVSPAANALPPRLPITRPSRAHQIISDTLENDGITPRAAGRMIDAAQARGTPLAIMDTGDNIRGLATGVANAPGKSRTVMRDAVIARQEGQTERVQGAINRDLGPTVGTATEAQRLEDSAKATAAPLYERAYASGAVDDPTITALMKHPEMQSALEAGKQMHANETFLANAKGEPAPAPMETKTFLRQRPDMHFEEVTTPDVRTLDYAKRALDRKIDGAYSGDAQAKAQLPFLKDLRTTLLTSLDKAVPDYGAARAAYAGPSAMKEALEAGKGAINKTADDIAAETRGLSPAELGHYKLGLRSALSDKIEGQPDGGAKAQALVGTPKKRKVLAEMFGGEDGFDRFMATIADEAKTSATYARVNAGSPTSRNHADDAHVAGETGVAASVGKASMKAMMGHHLGALTGLLGDASDRVARKASEGVRSELAAALSETDPVVLPRLFGWLSGAGLTTAWPHVGHSPPAVLVPSPPAAAAATSAGCSIPTGSLSIYAL